MIFSFSFTLIINDILPGTHITAVGSDYQSVPAVTIAAPATETLDLTDANVAILADDEIVVASAFYSKIETGDKVTYSKGSGGTAIAGVFGGLPNTSFSQNVGLISMTGVMSRRVVTIGAIFLIMCGLIPKIGALVSSMPIAVLGGGVIVMFGMVAAAGINMLSSVDWNRRNMMIFAISLSIGFGLQKVPMAMQHLDGTMKLLMTSGLLPAAVLAVVLNLVLPKE